MIFLSADGLAALDARTKADNQKQIIFRSLI